MPAQSNDSQPVNRSDLLAILTLIAVGISIYARTSTYPFISLDDPGYVVQNPHVNTGLTWANCKWAWTSFEQSNWHPLTWLSLMLDAQLYGLNAGGYHLTNLLLHLANGALLFFWLRRATRVFWPGALTAFFFVAHPLHVESVAWVTERKDVLSAFFFFLTLIAYSSYARSGKRLLFWLALALYALGLTAKPMLVSLAPLLLLLDYWPLERTASWRRLLAEKIPFFALSAGSCALTIIAQRAEALAPLAQLPIAYRAASAIFGCGAYLRLTFFPFDLGVYYPFWTGQSMVRLFAWIATLTGITIAAWAKRREAPFLIVGWLWFLGMLAPVIGLVQAGGQAIADRYTYLPHAGLFIAIFWGGQALARRWEAARPVLAVVAGGAAFACTALSCQQIAYWRDSVALFEHDVSVVHPSLRLYHLMADAYVEAGQPQKAAAVYLKISSAGPLDEETALSLSAVDLQLENWAGALAVLRPWAERPDASQGTLNNFAFALGKSGHAEEAQSTYERCVAEFPNYERARIGLAQLREQQGSALAGP